MKKLNSLHWLINHKTPENISPVIRVTVNFQVEWVFYTGERYTRAVRLNPDIHLSGVSDLLENATENMKIVCVEFAENALA